VTATLASFERFPPVNDTIIHGQPPADVSSTLKKHVDSFVYKPDAILCDGKLSDKPLHTAKCQALPRLGLAASFAPASTAAQRARSSIG
jgi:hypothetical protein